ncbi:ABC-three component system middle component 1 [Oceanisphaera sp. IT1-181]|uniref:ABC-three component system middle component 1 n=1 Tax=Oceanisphaera sp. IT1-181 TaxID=3081199 RepID=UPI0029C9B686|nr:ABC-three component system middle component 1 [Oceanisphaera sp. IT1-181]
MLTLHQVANGIIRRAEGRYDVLSAETVGLLLPEAEHASCFFRLKRSGIKEAGWRTILLIELPISSVQAAFHWAADVRDVLPEPETADLYMFLMISNITDNQATRIETDDRFCRKMVVRESEEVMDFLDRTFLAALDPPGDIETFNDPLLSALAELSAAHPWVSPHIIDWKNQLLSTNTGADVVQTLKASLSYSEEQ